MAIFWLDYLSFNSHPGIMIVVRPEQSPLETMLQLCFNSHPGIMIVVREYVRKAAELAIKFQFPCGNYGHCKILKYGTKNIKPILFQFPSGNYGHCKPTSLAPYFSALILSVCEGL